MVSGAYRIDVAPLPAQAALELTVGRTEGGTSVEASASPTAAEEAQACVRLAAGNLVVSARCNVPLLRRAMLFQQFGPALRLGIGNELIAQSGWEPEERGPWQLARSYYDERLAPFDAWQGAMVAELRQGGTWTAQVTNDATVIFPGRGSFSAENQQPTWTLAWRGEPGLAVTPLVQFGTYDLNHSHYLAAGALAVNGPWHGAVDVVFDARAQRQLHRLSTERITALRAEGSWQTGRVRPFVQTSAVDSAGAVEPEPKRLSHVRAIIGANVPLAGDALALFVAGDRDGDHATAAGRVGFLARF